MGNLLNARLATIKILGEDTEVIETLVRSEDCTTVLKYFSKNGVFIKEDIIKYNFSQMQIGDTIEYCGKKLKCVPEFNGIGGACTGCFFVEHLPCPRESTVCKPLSCGTGIRGIGKGAKFVEVK
jgi:hypothetical protein